MYVESPSTFLQKIPRLTKLGQPSYALIDFGFASPNVPKTNDAIKVWFGDGFNTIGSRKVAAVVLRQK